MSGGNANTTIAIPGHDWHVYWNNGGFRNFQLDIVGFLAVLGENSVQANAQVSALSSLFYLPRLIPAPQALLYPTRPESLPPKPGIVTGVESGMNKPHVHHVAHILLGKGNEMPAFDVRCVEVSKRPGALGTEELKQNWVDWLLRGERKASEERKRKLGRAAQLDKKPTFGPPLVKAKANGPLAWVTLFGCFLSVSLLIISIVLGDGMSLIATLLLSLLSTLTGLVNKWSLKLPQMPAYSPARPEKSKVVIRYPNGSFLVVVCDEDVARELFFAPEEIEYNIKSQAVYRLISLAGTLMLMGGIICLANAKLQLQFAWAGAYIIINAGHWAAAAVPSTHHWDLSCYDIKEQSVEGGPRNPNFTEALWRAILVTKSIAWVRNGPPAAPKSDAWDKWLDAAHVQASRVGSHEGPLFEVYWPGEDTKKGERPYGTIWDLPNWNAKDEWDTIYTKILTEEKEKAAKTGFTAPTITPRTQTV